MRLMSYFYKVCVGFLNKFRVSLTFCGLIFLGGAVDSYGQCEAYDGDGVLTPNPTWLSCFGTDYTLNFQSTTTFGAYTIDWGDGSPIESGASFAPPQVLSHTYAATVGSYTVTFTETSSACVITGTVIMEEPTTASIQIPFGGVTQTCAPAPLSFINSSTNVSPTTVFTWDFGDGSPAVVLDYTNSGDTVIHDYLQGTVDCETQVSLVAENQCNIAQGGFSQATFNPIRIWDLDQAAITASDVLLCFPETTVSFENTTQRNCLAQGNTFQRQEYWNFGDYWGLGYDSIVDWTPWPPTFPHVIDYPGLGTYDVMMIDSNFCGQDTAYITIQIVPPPTSAFTLSTDTTCANTNITASDASTGGANTLSWNFGDGSGWQTLGANPAHAYVAPGDYTIQLAASIGGANGCTDTSSLDIHVLPIPSANFVLDNNEGCDQLTVNFTDASLDAIDWDWNFDNGNTFNGLVPPSQNYTASGTYQPTLTVTALNGCTDVATGTINVYQSPVVDFLPQSVCQNADAIFTDQSTSSPGDPIVAWDWDFGNGDNSTQQNPTTTYLANGSYDIILEVATAHCSNTDTISVTVEPIPSAAFTQNINSGCPSLPVQFTNQSTGATGYQWNFGDGGGSTNLDPLHVFQNTFASDTTYQIEMIASTTFGCTDTAYASVDVYYGVNSAFSHNGFPGCAPLDVVFTNLSTVGQTYEWDFGDGNTDVAYSTTHQYINTTQFIDVYNVELVVTSPNGCTDTSTQDVTVYPLPDFDFSSVPDSGCSPLTVNFPTVVGAVTYEWDFGDGNSAMGVSPSHVYTNATTNDVTYIVELIATSPFGCQDTNYGQVKVFPNPTSQFTAPVTDGCGPFTVTFENTSIGATSFQWDYDDGNTSATTLASHNYTYANPSNSNLVLEPSLIAITDDGCRDTSTLAVTVYPEVIADFTVDTVGCEPFIGDFTDQSQNADQWSWDFGNGFSSILQNPTQTFNNPTSTDVIYTVEMIASSVNGCRDTAYQEMLIYPTPIAQFLPSVSVGCAPLNFAFQNNSIDGTFYDWDFDDGNTSTSTLTNFPYFYENQTSSDIIYNPTLVVSSPNGCADTATMAITVHPEITADFTVDTAGCTPFHAIFNDQSTNAAQWLWDFDNGFMDTQQNPNEFLFNPGTTDSIYTVQLIATSAEGCKDTAYQDILVFPVPNSLFTPSPFTQTYPSTTVSFNNASTTGSWEYYWNFGDGDTAIGFTPADHVYPTWGDFEIELIVASDFCSDTSTQTITIIPPLPEPHIYGSGEGCRPVTIQFYDSSLYVDSYYWDFGDGGFSTLQNPYYTYHQAGDYTVTVTLTGPGGVETFVMMDSVHVYEYAVAFFQYAPSEVYVPDEPVQFYNLSSYSDDYIWDFGDGNTTTDEHPEHFYANEGLYDITLIANNANNCPDTVTFEQAVLAETGGEIEFPNAFTPNTSGPTGGSYDPSSVDNDVFFPVFKGVEDYHLSIFNRWGELIFESFDVAVGWDGYYREQLCQQDVYIWKARVKYTNGNEETYVGEIHLLR
ncbi:hypothetical protein CRYO30217_03325 [Parvicella tangerina]|uniref:PKD domain-containing protein n=2 Tax=Parvicella tangerina TaxID=2829795 RepID=A0A916NK46_9FLAO|nr:hypothetical protein CRYO30217_03325 [Parvicella tangerina]